MAGDPISVINNWLLDYCTYLAWEEFKLDHTISASTLDLISGILSKSWEGEEHRNDKKLFLTVLSRMRDGKDINMRYEETSTASPLEDLVTHFESLVNFQLDDGLIEEGELLQKVIKCEAVQVCCRAGDFEKAQVIYDKYFQKVKNDRISKNLRKFIKEKIKEMETSYSDFISAMVEYLEQISNNFDEPTMITAARIFMARVGCKQDVAMETQDTQEPIPADILDEVKGADSNNSSVSNDKRKLRKLWDQKISAMFGSLSPKKSGESTCKSPTQEPPVSDGLSPKISRNRLTETNDNKSSPLKRPTNSNQLPFKMPAPKATGMKSPKEKREVASTSSQSSRNVPVSFISPVKRSSVPDSPEDRSPSFQYRKNKGRADRHLPVMSSTRIEQADDDDDSDRLSTFSMSTKRKWTEDEMIEFYDAVLTCGVGNWAKIKEYLDTTRTNVMLKDKWRNMIKSGDAERIRDERKKRKVTK